MRHKKLKLCALLLFEFMLLGLQAQTTTTAKVDKNKSASKDSIVPDAEAIGKAVRLDMVNTDIKIVIDYNESIGLREKAMAGLATILPKKQKTQIIAAKSLRGVKLESPLINILSNNPSQNSDTSISFNPYKMREIQIKFNEQKAIVLDVSRSLSERYRALTLMHVDDNSIAEQEAARQRAKKRIADELRAKQNTKK